MPSHEGIFLLDLYTKKVVYYNMSIISNFFEVEEFDFDKEKQNFIFIVTWKKTP